jgi:hypothetical protein
MALFRNLGVNLWDRLCDVPTYVSAQSLDFLDLANPAMAGLNWKLTPVPTIQRFIYGWARARMFSKNQKVTFSLVGFTGNRFSHFYLVFVHPQLFHLRMSCGGSLKVDWAIIWAMTC